MQSGAPVELRFDTVELIRQQADHIDLVAAAGPDAVNDFMPAAEPVPSLEQRYALGEWLACGAP
jgi:hypothetical protein